MRRIFSSVHLDPGGTLEGVRACIDDAIGNDAQGLLLLIGASSDLGFKSLPSELASLPIPAIAAVFPGVIYEKECFQQGVLVCGLTSPLSARLLPDITKPEPDLKQDLAAILEFIGSASTVFLILNGLSKGGDNFVTTLHELLGPEIQVIGAGCGHLNGSNLPNIITPEGALTDAALLVFQESRVIVSVRHGWEPVDGPFLITEASDNVIHQINYQPARTFYLNLVEKHHGGPVSPERFASVTSRYPFGLEQLDSEFLVRDPVAAEGQSLVCAGAIPTNAMVYLLHAEQDSLVDAAGSAASWLREQHAQRYESEKGLKFFAIDCISRSLVLGDDFHLELETIRDNLPESAEMLGVLSIGEIASSDQGGIQWLNKTTLIGGLSE
jgi:hypothetical protein